MNEDQRKITRSFFFPALLVLLIWLVKLFEITFDIDLTGYGLWPLQWKGLIGIVTAPLLHANLSHLSANSFPLFFLGALLFYFYKPLAWRVFFLIWFLTGLWVWVFARGEAVHIGASGVVYGLAAFLFLSGILRRDNKLMAITLLIAFIYGGLVWGVFPQFFPNQPISWESHLMGLLAGTVLAVYYRNAGPQRIVYQWDDEGDDDDDDYQGYEEDEPGEEDEWRLPRNEGNQTS